MLIILDQASHINGRSLDIWSLGITLFCLVHGYCPFEVEDGSIIELYKKINNDPVVFADGISADLQDLIEKMLIRDPLYRITIHQIKQHPWTTSRGLYPMMSMEENCKEFSSSNIHGLSFKPVKKFVSKVLNSLSDYM